MRSDKKPPLKSDKKSPPKIQKKGTLGYNKKSALLEDAITQMNAGKYGRASSALKDLLTLDPLNAEARRLFATLHLRLGSLMSARTAFESLAREAMERQDYWLAESLLREYLTAGPRCVPFLEMLGQVYEGKGDVMAAVAEYGKAVEVLLEDPDSEHPNRAAELFGKIRSIAPGSPVAFRFAAMFDTVTGQVLQTSPQSTGAEAERESVSVNLIPESTDDPAAAGTMSWEQMDSTPAEGAISAGGTAPIPGESPESKDAPVPLVSVQPVTEFLKPANAPDSAPAMQAADSAMLPEVQPPHDSSSVSGAVPADPGQMASQDEVTAVGSMLPVQTVAEDATPAIEVLTEGNSQPITVKPISPAPMPWDQLEDDLAAVSPAIVSELSGAVEVSPARAVEAGLPAPADAEGPAGTVTTTNEGRLLPFAETVTGSASLSLEQHDEVLPASSQEFESPSAIGAEAVSLVAGAADLTVSPVVEAASPIEVLRTSSALPITEPPASPASMPWDQVEEMPGTSLSMADSEPVAEVKEATESAAVSSPLNAGSVADSPVEPSSSFTSSLGLSWEDILAAVTAMQSSPAYPPAQPLTEREVTTDIAGPDEWATRDRSHQDPMKTDWLSVELPASNTFAGQIDNSPPLSAPMPWEQVEVEEVAILRPDPEPEFGAVSPETGDAAQDLTVIMPVAEEMPDSAPVVPSLAHGVAPDNLSDMDSSATVDFRILSADAPDETLKQPLSIHIPLEAVEPAEPVREPELGAEFESAASAESAPEMAGEPLRLAGSEASELQKSDEPEPLSAESPAEAIELASVNLSPPSPQLLVEDIEVSLVQSTEVVLSNSPSTEDESSVVVTGQEPTSLATSEPMAEVTAPSVVADPPVIQTETIAVMSEVVPVTEDSEPTPEPERLPLSTQELGSISELAGNHIAISASSESGVSPEQVSIEQASAGLGSHPTLSIAAPVAVGSGELELTSVESEPVVQVDVQRVDSEVPAVSPAVTHAPEPTATPDMSAEDGLHILWDDSSSKPIPSASIGNMLTRWLKRPADVTPAETSVPAQITESGLPVVPTLVDPQETVAYPAERPIDRPVAVTLAPVEQQATRIRPSRPVGEQAWRLISRAALSLIGAGVSTTRSMVVSVVALLGLSAALVAGCVGIVAVTWLILEEQPTPAYRSMTSVPQQSLQDSQKNGYFLLLGFGAAPTQDPVQTGIDRRAEETDRAVTHACLTGEGNGSGSQQGASAEVAGKWLKSVDPAAQMRVESTGVKSWVSQAGVAMGRYRQWLSKPFEDWGYGQPVSPNCGIILSAHRLYVAEGFAQDVEAGVARLETDLTAWRTVFGQAKTMPIKMLAGDALNEDIAVVSGLLLRPDLDDRLISRLAKLARPLDQSEQSIRWPMQSQFVVATKMLGDAVNHDPGDARPFYGSLAAALPLPKQRRFNAYAQYYEAAGKAAAEGDYADLPKQSQFMRTSPFGLADVFVKPIESLVGIEPLPTWETFAGRVLETEARLRLASLQAWLRRTPPEQDLLTRVAKAGQGLYDPFTGYPMLVNMKKGVFYSVGRDMKDNEAQDRFDIVAQIPPSAWADGKRTADLTDSK